MDGSTKSGRFHYLGKGENGERERNSERVILLFSELISHGLFPVFRFSVGFSMDIAYVELLSETYLVVVDKNGQDDEVEWIR